MTSSLDLFIFINATVGLTYIVTKSAIFHSFRDFFLITEKHKSLWQNGVIRRATDKFGSQEAEGYEKYVQKKLRIPFIHYSFNVIYKVITCPLCFGFWSGLMTYSMQSWGWDPLLYGFMGSIDSYLVYLLVESLYQYFEEK